MEDDPISMKNRCRLVALVLVLAFIATCWAAPLAQAAWNIHRVKSGDTLWAIAQENGVTVRQLQELNRLKGSTIYPGQELQLPSGVTSGRYYTVQGGDSLWVIGQRTGHTVTELKTANGLTSSLIYPGQKLLLPAQSREPSRRATDEDLYWLARAISAEAKGEPYKGQVAVGAVIVNRAKSPHFPNTIKGVIFQQTNGVYQFSPVENGSIYREPAASAYEAARQALAGYDPTGGALYFYNPRLTGANNWIRTRPVVTVVNNHVFAL